MEIERSAGECMYSRINGCGKCAPITRARVRDSGRKKDEKISLFRIESAEKRKLCLNNR